MSKKKGLTKKELRKERKAKKAQALIKLSNGLTKKTKKQENLTNDRNIARPEDVEVATNIEEESPTTPQHEGPTAVNENVTPENCDVQMKSVQMQVEEKQRFRRVVLRLKDVGREASLDKNFQKRIPLFLSDIQHLLLSTTLDSIHPYSSPRWVSIEKRFHLVQNLILIIDGFSVDHYLTQEPQLSNLKRFSIKCEVITPALYGGSIIDELATIPLTDNEKEVLVQEYGSIEAAMQSRKDLMVMLKMVFPVKDMSNHHTVGYSTDNFPRTQLIMSAWQLVEDNYPLPLKGKNTSSYAGYVMSKDLYEPVSPSSPMFGLDCEMCKTIAGTELTRISLVNEQHEVVYEKLVLPHNEIVDYLTQYSGITAEMMTNVKTRITDVQRDIREILPPDAILVGQSLNFDLNALKMMHPYIIDTSVIFNTTGERNRKSKLKVLAKTFLQQDIQEGNQGHCPVEDSIASLKLVQLKLTNNISFGDAILASRNKLTQENQKKNGCKEYSTNIYNKLAQHEKTSIVVGHESITQKYSNYVKKICRVVKSDGGIAKQKKIKCINCEDNASVIEKTKDLLTGKHNLVMSHINMESDTVENDANLIQNVNQWIDDLYNCSPSNTQIAVLFSGTSTCNGAYFVTIKK